MRSGIETDQNHSDPTRPPTQDIKLSTEQVREQEYVTS